MAALRKKMALAALPVIVAGGALVVLRPWASEGSTPDAPTNPGEFPTIIAVGDIGRCGEEVDEATAAIVERLPEATLLALGDIAYNNGSAENFEECYDPSWGPFVDRTRPVPGNHEYRTDDAAPYFDYFGSVAGDPGKGWYSFDLGEWHVVALNSNCEHVACDAGSEQEQWLRADLETTDARCTLAFWHHPRFSSGEKHGGTKDVEDLWQLLLDHDVEALLSGHEHLYERTAPLDADGDVDPENGVRQFVVGTGGGNFYELGEPIAGSETAIVGTGGVLSMTLRPDEFEWEFLSVGSAEALDAGSAECH